MITLDQFVLALRQGKQPLLSKREAMAIGDEIADMRPTYRARERWFHVQTTFPPLVSSDNTLQQMPLPAWPSSIDIIPTTAEAMDKGV